MNVSDIQSKLKLSYYKEIATLNAEHGIVVVQHINTGKIYVKKAADINSRKVYEQLKKTPVQGVPKTHEVCVLDDKLYIIEDQISGKNLQEILDERGRLPEKEVRLIGISLCDILTRLHSLNPPVIHRDIKPSNVIITDDGRVILIDFDGAKQADYSASRDTHLIGTAGYAAPEQYGFDSSKPQTDIYGVGKLMLALLTGGTDASVLKKCEIKRVIDKCLQMDPKQRYKSTKSLKYALRWTRKAVTIAVIATIVLCLYAYGRFTQPSATPANNAESFSSEATSVANISDAKISMEEIGEHTPVGAYEGNDKEKLVIMDDGLAYYYCYDVTYTEVACPWQMGEDEISIELSKLHCTITAKITDNDFSELVFKSDSTNWNSEVFEKISPDAEKYYVSPPPSASEYIEVEDDGSMHFGINGFCFSVPKQFRDCGREYNKSPDKYYLVDVSSDNYFTAPAIFYLQENIVAHHLEAEAEELANDFASLLMNNVQIGYSEQVKIAGRDAYKVGVSGMLNQEFYKISNRIHTGHVYLTPNPKGNGVIFILLMQTPGEQIDDTEIFESIISSTTFAE